MYICNVSFLNMNKREQIIQIADCLIREKGYNAFSFYDISKKVGIKTASIHYHFPLKSDLGVAVIEGHIEMISNVIEKHKSKSPTERLDKFFSIYSDINKENKVCLVGSLASNFNTLDEQIQINLIKFTELMLNWVCGFLEEGRNSKVFSFEGSARTKAVMIITNMLALLQLSRLSYKKEFKSVVDIIKLELITK
jgi:TetR/AcrR family transcriptional regulator, transcriptional repressor for nem operon